MQILQKLLMAVLLRTQRVNSCVSIVLLLQHEHFNVLQTLHKRAGAVCDRLARRITVRVHFSLCCSSHQPYLLRELAAHENQALPETVGLSSEPLISRFLQLQ